MRPIFLARRGKVPPKSVRPTFTPGKEKSDEGEAENHVTVYEDFNAASPSQAIHAREDGFLPCLVEIRRSHQGQYSLLLFRWVSHSSTMFSLKIKIQDI